MDAITSAAEGQAGLRQACAILRDRLRAGEPTRVEDLLASHPALALDDESVFELIHTEISVRHDLGDRPTLEEWQGRFPTLLGRRDVLDSLRTIFGTEMHTLSDSPLPDPAFTPGQGRVADRRLPKVANYQLIQEIGRGGMGVVYKARQTGLSRVVALKMILAGEHAGLRERARLRNEAEAAAQLLHPNVVQIIEIGEHEGLPFLAMEFVPGGNLASMIRGMPQAFRWSARLAETLARTIHVAHERGIIHRDLNPSNILMTTDGTPKITDFGLAKFLVDDAGVSLNGVILGTPSYMAPEQVTTHPQGIGPGTDVYALGALLYEMLTGTTPFRGFTPMETMCQVVEAEVVPPSRLRHGLPQDLETICLKCLEKEPGRRYPSAEALADDLRRFQENEPILARRSSRLHQALHWTRRQPLAARLLGLSLALLIALLAMAGGYFATMQSVKQRLKGDLDAISRVKYMSDLNKSKYESGVKDREIRLRYDSMLGQVKRCFESGQVELAQELFENLDAEETPGFERSYLDRLIHGASRRLGGHSSNVTCLAVADVGALMASGDESGRVYSRELGSDRTVRCQGGHESPVRMIAVVGAAHGRKPSIASLSQQPDGPVDLRLWDAGTGAPMQRFREEGLEAKELVFSREGSQLTLRGTTKGRPARRSLQLSLDASGWHETARGQLREGAIQACSRDGRLVATTGDEGTVHLDGPGKRAGSPLLPGKGAKVRSLGFSPGSSKLVAGREDGSITVWDASDGRLLANESDRGGPVAFAGFAGEDTLVGCDGSRSLWTERLGQPASLRHLTGVDGQVGAITFSPDGTLLAAALNRRRVKIWDLTTAEVLGTFVASGAELGQLAFASDGKCLFLSGADPSPCVWRFRESGDISETLTDHGAPVLALAFSPDDHLLASCSADRTIRIWRVETGELLLTLTGHDDAVTSMAFLSNGRLATGGRDGQVLLWEFRREDGESGKVSVTRSSLFRGDEPIDSLGIPAVTGSYEIAIGGSSGTIRILDMATRAVKCELKGHTGSVRSITYCGLGAVASASEDRCVRVWDGQTGVLVKETKLPAAMRALAFFADDQSLAASGDTRVVQILSTVSSDITLTMSAHPLPVRCVDYSPLGRMLASGCDDGIIRLWDASTGLQLYTLEKHQGPINDLAFSSDGLVLASGDESGRVNLWHARNPVGSGHRISPSP